MMTAVDGRLRYLRTLLRVLSILIIIAAGRPDKHLPVTESRARRFDERVDSGEMRAAFSPPYMRAALCIHHSIKLL